MRMGGLVDLDARKRRGRTMAVLGLIVVAACAFAAHEGVDGGVTVLQKNIMTLVHEASAAQKQAGMIAQIGEPTYKAEDRPDGVAIMVGDEQAARDSLENAISGMIGYLLAQTKADANRYSIDVEIEDVDACRISWTVHDKMTRKRVASGTVTALWMDGDEKLKGAMIDVDGRR